MLFPPLPWKSRKDRDPAPGIEEQLREQLLKMRLDDVVIQKMRGRWETIFILKGPILLKRARGNSNNQERATKTGNQFSEISDGGGPGCYLSHR